MDTTAPNAGRPALRRWAPALIGLPAAGLVIALAAVLSSSPASGGPSVALGNGSAACIEVYTPENLLHREFAFDGTVTAIQSSSADFGVEVSFDVNEAFIGDVGSTITLTAPGVGGDSEGGPAIAVGDRLLISGDETYAWTCGFSRTWSAEMAAEWEAATR